MQSTELREIDRALRSVGRTLDAWYLSSDAGDLRAIGNQPADDNNAVKRECAVRERAAIHFCLTSASVLLGATQRLLTESAPQPDLDRKKRLFALIDDLNLAARSVSRAGSALAGHDACMA